MRKSVMRTLISIILIILILLVCVTRSCDNTETRKDIYITPRPSGLTLENGVFTIDSNTKISVENKEQAKVAGLFTSLVNKSTGSIISVSENSKDANIKLISDNTLSKTGSYILKVTKDSIIIKASSLAGFFYAFQTIRLSLPSGIESGKTIGMKLQVPAMSITDQPRFEYRGLMLDVARFFMPLDGVKKVIDCMSMLKLNKLHLHLSDDTGWRLEIKKYPKLTEVGAWRVDRSGLPFYERRNQQPGEKATYGGYYTQDEIRELVEYASIRQVEIIPEIDVPAHSCAALASYPELACPNVKKQITVLPGLGGRDTEIIYCAGKEETFKFLSDVIDEVDALFPSQYIHMGGDEANKFYWNTCPLCKKRMKEESIAEVEDLQGYFMQRVSKYIKSKGKTMIGWDELTNSTVPEGTVIMGWQGNGNAALKAAEKGHQFIMTPARLLYLIRYQGPQWFEPLTYFGNNLMKDIYMYEPIQKNWNKEYSDLLIGVQASMWTEFCNSTDDVMYQIFPRLAALAEVAWSDNGEKDWDTFQKALDNYLEHLDAKNVKYAKSMFNIQHKSIPTGNGIKVSLESERTDVEIRYTTDGSEPDIDSHIYTDTLFISGNTVLKAATFKDSKLMGKTLKLDLNFNKATGKIISGNNKDEYLLTNGIRGSLRESDFEWCTNYRSDNNFVLDLQKQEKIQKVKLGCLTNYGMGVHIPRRIKIEFSDNGKEYTTVKEKVFSDEEIFKEGNLVEDISFEFENTETRYIKVFIEDAGKIPSTHFMRPGQFSKFCIDEIIIE